MVVITFLICKDSLYAGTTTQIDLSLYIFLLHHILSFFHDILNTATGLQGTIDLLINYKDKINTDELMERAERITKNLIKEIKSQQLLIAAENDILELSPTIFNSIEILNDVEKTYENHDLSKGKILKIAPHSKNVEIGVIEVLLLFM